VKFNPDEYITVAERLEKFYAKFPGGRILTSILEHDADTGFVLMKAEAYREADDASPSSSGHAYELRSAGHVQAGSYVEVCETSAVGRALAMLGFEVQRGVASREEVKRGQAKATETEARGQETRSLPAAASKERPRKPSDPRFRVSSDQAGSLQLKEMQGLAETCGVELTGAVTKTFSDPELKPEQLNKAAAEYMIDLLRRKRAEQREVAA
jgi:hypothetical protein